MGRFIHRYLGSSTFVFKLEPPEYELLHIYARHLIDEQDAIQTLLDGTSVWNSRLSRWETTDFRHTVYWFWLSEKKDVRMIITCFANNHVL